MKMFHLSRSLVALLFSATIKAGQSGLNSSNPTAGAALENFAIDRDASAVSMFSCNILGSRCVFQRSDYQTIDFGSGQESQDPQGAVWAAIVANAVLTLGPCTANNSTGSSSCIVTCNANCSCAYTTNVTAVPPKACAQISSRAPTMAPRSQAPVATVCPKKQFKEFCPDLMKNALPPGLDKEYDCYNFCGGVWISTCDLATGACGTTDCTNKTAAGTANGQVFGCTLADKQASSATGSGSTKTTTSGSAPSGIWTGSTALVLFIVGSAAIGFILQIEVEKLC